MTSRAPIDLATIATAARSTLAHAGLQQDLDALLAAARLAWPGVPLDDAVFVAHLAACLPTEGDLRRGLAELHATDLYLTCACALGAPQAIAAFEREPLALVGLWISRIDRSSDFVDEVTQRVRERLLVGSRPRIVEYNGTGALVGWTRVAVVRVALKLRREAKRGTLELRESDEPIAAAEVDAIHGLHQAEIERALKLGLSRLAPADRELVRLHYVEGMTLQRIGELRKVDKSTASRQLAAVRGSLRENARCELERLIPGVTAGSPSS